MSKKKKPGPEQPTQEFPGEGGISTQPPEVTWEEEPVQIEAQPAQAEAQPAQAEAQPAQPEAQPVQPEAQSTQAEAEPIQPEAQSTQAEAEPIQPEAQSTQAEAEPIQPEAQSTQAEAEPIQPEAQPAQAEAQPAPGDGSTPVNKSLTRYLIWGVVALIVVAIGILASLGSGGGLGSDPPLEIQADSKGFSKSGVFTLTGFGNMTPEEIKDALRFEPEAECTVTLREDDPQVAEVAIANWRNASYKGIFTVEHPPASQWETSEASSGGTSEEEGSQAEKPYEVKFTINGPPLVVSISSGAQLTPKQSITLRFSEQVDIDSLYQYMTIQPQTAYTISYSRTEVTITPDNEWNISDNYRIRINAMYTGKSGKQFDSHQVLSFKVKAAAAQATPTPQVEFVSDGNYVLNEHRDMTLLFYAQNLKDDLPVIVETYKMDSIEKYRQQGHIYLDYGIPLDTLEKVDTNAFLVRNKENYLSLPHQGGGGYIVSATYKHPHTKKQVEVRTSYLITPISVYMQSSNRETLIWLNSADGAALSGYEFTFDAAEESGVTDSSGVLVVPHREIPVENSKGEVTITMANRNAFSVHNPQGELVYYDQSGLDSNMRHSERYYSYMFLDRTLYRPEDTIQFWGFIQPFRYNTKEMPETVTVRFDPGGLDLRIECPLEPSGVFSGEIPLEKVKSSQYEISAYLYFPAVEGEETGTTHYFEWDYVSVKEYEKPSYTLSSGVDKSYYGPYDTVTVTATAAFFDGTPLPHFPLEVSYYDAGAYSWVRLDDALTDDLGNATFSFPASSGKESIYSSKGPTSNSYRVQIASDGEQISHGGRYTYFPSDTLVETKLERQEDGLNLALTVNAYKLNMDSPQLKEAMESEEYGYYYYLSEERLLEIARGAPTDVEMEVALRWDYFDTRGIRHRYYYDYYNWNRQSILFADGYSLNYILDKNPGIETFEDPNTKEKKIKIQTENGTATVTDLIYLGEGMAVDWDRDVFGRAYMSYRDPLQNYCESYAYYPSRERYHEDWEEGEKEPVPGYSFQVTNLDTGADITPENFWFRTVTMNVGARAQFDLLLDGIPADSGGRIFYSIIQDGLYEWHVVPANSFNLEFKLAWANNVRLVAVYFDGNGTQEIKQIDLNANRDSLNVNIDVTPDRDSYRPGDTVNLAVKATDQSGAGVAGNLCVAVVDEAIFALSEQYISVLNDLYADVWGINNYVSQYFTAHRDEPFDQMPADAGKGQGGAVDFYDSYRSNFKDTALFYPTRTDAAGNARITFTLPDNTTSWRITAVEITDSLLAGQHKSNFISTLPFFVKPVITSKYIDGDDFTMLVQGHGTLLTAGEDISYTVTVTGDDGFREQKTAQGKAYQPVEMNFGKLPIGEYTVVSRAQYSGYADTVELPVAFIKSNLELVISKELELGETLDIDAMRYPVTITLYNRDHAGFMASVNSMFGHYCMQTSQRLSRFVAKRVLRQNLPERDVPSYIADTKENIADMQNLDGGVGHVLGGDSDPLLTAYVLLIAKDQFNLPLMAEYFHGQIKTLSDEKTIAACRLGLAAIGDSKAEELLVFLEETDRHDIRAYYIAALAYLDETEKALELYEKHLSPVVERINQRATHPVEFERDLAAIWVASCQIKPEDADAISLHFGQNRWRIRTLYEAMIYVTSYDRVVTPVTVSYVSGGQSYTADLGYGGMKTIRFGKSQLETLRFTGGIDSASAVAHYVGEPTELGLEPSPNMNIKKEIAAIDATTYEVTLTINLGKDAPLGQYDISDWVPSNCRLYDNDKSYLVHKDYRVNFRTTSEGQNLYISFDSREQRAHVIEYKYRIRKTFGGEAVLDTTYMIHGDTGENCNSEKGVFTPE